MLPILMDRRQVLRTACQASGVMLAAAALPRALPAAEDQNRRRVAITIDDGPAADAGQDLQKFVRISTALRETFVAEEVPAIMFVNERQCNVPGERDARTNTLEAWLDAGLELGNHTYSHKRPDPSNLAEYLDDIVKGEVLSRPLLEQRGQALTWFRYPFLASSRGETAQQIEDFLARRNYRIAPVTVDYKDYSFARNYSRFIRAGEVAAADDLFSQVQRALDSAFERSEQQSLQLLGYLLPQILLIHCNEMNSLRLRDSLKRMRDRGYEFVPLGDAMADPAYAAPDLAAGQRGNGLFLEQLAIRRRQR